ncbi:MAG: sortase [Ruminococcaceae bacterium]|nr:sortase [Oscillospiraceae bacterium]
MKLKRGSICIFAGLLLIAAAFSITIYNRWEDYRAEQSVLHVMEQLPVVTMERESAVAAEQIEPETEAVVHVPPVWSEPVPVETIPAEAEIPDYILNPHKEMPVQNVDGRDYIGIVEIEACSMSLPVISHWSYPALKVAPCRFDGSVYTDTMIVAGHDYRAHFKLLRSIGEGTKVQFTDTEGNLFSYTVSYTEIVGSSDVEGLAAGEWDLTLFTCTADGSSRFVVRCERNQNK